jgi:DNA repair exonuclease SbcCD ATPase subunit
MKILKYDWKNFNSYGNVKQEMTFDNNESSLNLINAKNGFGKSTIAEVLEFNIFGKVTNKNLTDLPNRINLNLETSSSIQTQMGVLNINRNYSPNSLEVTLDGKTLSDVAGKKTVQKQIEKEILDIDNFMFKNLIMLDVNKFKSFVKMTKADKKSLIDRVFGLNILTLMYTEIQTEIKANRIKEAEINSNIYELNKHIEFAQQKSIEIQEKIQENNNSKIDEIKQNIVELQEKEKTIKNKFALLKDKITTHQSKLNNTRSIKNGIEFDIKQVLEKIKLYERNKQCPLCGSDFSSPTHQEDKNNYIQQSITLKKSYESVLIEEKNINESLEKFIKIERQGLSNLTALQTDIRHFEKELGVLSTTTENEQLDGLTGVITHGKEQIEEANEKHDDIQTETKFLNIMSTVLGENGVKKNIIDKIIPHLNTEINTLLRELDLGYSLSLDSNLETKVVYLGRDLSISTLSTGESKKFDFAILVSFIKLLKTRFTDINVLFLDEIFSGLDLWSVDKVCEILKRVSSELKLHIYLINHTLIDSNLFDNVLEIKKDDANFSFIDKD